MLIDFYVLVPFLSVLVISTRGRLSQPALGSTLGRTIKQIYFDVKYSSNGIPNTKF